MRVDVRVRVLGLAMLRQHPRRDLEDLADELEHRIVGEVLQRELALAHVAGVRFAQDRVAVARYHASVLERVPEVLGDVFVAEVAAHALLHLLQPVEDFLVGEAVEGAREAVEACREREHG